MITFRLADALPAEKLIEFKQKAPFDVDSERRRRLESYLDAGHGTCHLRDPRVARLVEAVLRHGDGKQYRLLAWVIMPNHVHALLEILPGHAVSEIIQAWKSVSARSANVFLGRGGRFWQPDYFDRAVRDERHLAAAIRYIHENPVKAGLVRQPEDWTHSSAASLEHGS
jgi:type I restriction enzyme R subunit/putative DNA methylase